MPGFTITFVEMGASDLNSKKSWNPKSVANREKVLELERRAAMEKQRMEQLAQERKAELDSKSILQQQEALGLVPPQPEKVDWVYKDNASTISTCDEDLLTGRRVASVRPTARAWVSSVPWSIQPQNSAERDKIKSSLDREDPLASYRPHNHASLQPPARSPAVRLNPEMRPSSHGFNGNTPPSSLRSLPHRSNADEAQSRSSHSSLPPLVDRRSDIAAHTGVYSRNRSRNSKAIPNNNAVERTHPQSRSRSPS